MRRYIYLSIGMNILLLLILLLLLFGKQYIISDIKDDRGQSLSDERIKNKLDDNPGITFLCNSLTAYADWRQLLDREKVNVYGIDYIDLNRLLSDENGLMEKYTTDGTHLSREGYAIWSKKLCDFIADRFKNLAG